MVTNKLTWETIIPEGDALVPTFAHTSVLINNIKVVIFGGAIVSDTNFVMVDHLYIYNIFKNELLKLEGRIQ